MSHLTSQCFSEYRCKQQRFAFATQLLIVGENEDMSFMIVLPVVFMKICWCPIFEVFNRFKHIVHQDAWNTKNPTLVSKAYTKGRPQCQLACDCCMRKAANRPQSFLQKHCGRAIISYVILELEKD